jgi:hypothetical protein
MDDLKTLRGLLVQLQALQTERHVLIGGKSENDRKHDPIHEENDRKHDPINEEIYKKRSELRTALNKAIQHIQPTDTYESDKLKQYTRAKYALNNGDFGELRHILWNYPLKGWEHLGLKDHEQTRIDKDWW